MKLYAPNGLAIVGTAELVPGTAGVASWKRSANGHPEVEDWEGGTEMYWDCSETQVSPDGSVYVVDEDGVQWCASECELRDE